MELNFFSYLFILKGTKIQNIQFKVLIVSVRFSNTLFWRFCLTAVRIFSKGQGCMKINSIDYLKKEPHRAEIRIQSQIFQKKIESILK